MKHMLRLTLATENTNFCVLKASTDNADVEFYKKIGFLRALIRIENEPVSLVKSKKARNSKCSQRADVK